MFVIDNHMVLKLNAKNAPTKQNRKAMERMLYAYGYTEPHYPVPAIRYKVEFQHDRIICWNYTHWTYPIKYLYIRL